MSALATRLRRLEQRLGGCPGCAHRRTLIELVGPAASTLPAEGPDTRPCPDCGQPRERIRVRLAFDPHAGTAARWA